MRVKPYIQASEIHAGDVLDIDLHVMVNMHGGLSVSMHKFDDHIYLGPTSMSFTVPEGFNPIVQAVASIEAKLTALSDVYQKEKTKLLEKKAQLLQISYGGNDILDAIPKENE